MRTMRTSRLCGVVALLAVLLMPGCAVTGNSAADEALYTGIAGIFVFAGYELWTYLQPDIETELTAAGSEAAIKGIELLPAAVQPTAAADTVKAAAAAIEYLNVTATGQPGNVVNAEISKILGSVDTVIITAIQDGAAILGTVVPVDGTQLNALMVADLVAFLTGVENGAATLQNPSATQAKLLAAVHAKGPYYTDRKRMQKWRKAGVKHFGEQVGASWFCAPVR